jgi:hypothetical protein
VVGFDTARWSSGFFKFSTFFPIPPPPPSVFDYFESCIFKTALVNNALGEGLF